MSVRAPAVADARNPCAYAAEKLVAELGAASAMASLGMASELNPHYASYLAGWLTLLRADNRAIFAAARRAVDYMLVRRQHS